MKDTLWMRETRPRTARLWPVWRFGGILLIASLVVMALGFFPTHSAQAASISGSPFTSPGEHSFVVPTGVTSLKVVTIGGKGGTGGTECTCQGSGAAGASGASGAMVTATVAVTPGSTLWVEVGRNGGNGANDPNTQSGTDAGGAGGTDGGGAGGTSINFYGGGGGGGGYSALRACPLSGNGCPSNPWLVVAGGGGGGAGGGTIYNGYAGAGGTPNGQNGANGAAGTGGSQTAAGSGGPDSGGYSAGGNGSGTNGGVGSNAGSGGGGGGYFGGGGGGGYLSGGGGGSSYGPSNATYTTTTNAPSVDVTINDTTAPTLQLPSTITTTATSASGATVNYTVTATDPDNASSDLTISCSPASGSTFAIGTTTVNCSASDPAGNKTTGSFDVVVNDVPPTLNLPSTITTDATGLSGATVNYTVTASDSIYTASQLTISCSPASGSAFAIGTDTVNCSVTDPANTTVTGSFDVVVKDVTAPTLQLPSTITTTATSASGATVNYTVTATDPDNASSDLTISCSPASGSTFAIGTTKVNCSATDPSGNKTTGSFDVVVNDVPPTLNLPSTITTDATGPSGAVVTYTVTASDSIYSASQLTINCSPVSGSTFAIGTDTVNCSVTDPANTTVTGSFQIVVKGAATQVNDLINTVNSFQLDHGTQNSLDSQLQAVLADLQANNPTQASSDLTSFINHVKAQSGKKLTVAQAQQLLQAASNIQAVLA